MRCLFTLLLAAEVSAIGADLVFVLDTSTTMIQPQRYIASGAGLAIRELRTGDRIGVVTFANDVQIRLQLSGEPQSIKRAFQKAIGTVIERTRPHRVYDGIDTALQAFPVEEHATDGRRVLVITNDFDVGSTHDFGSLIRDATAKGVEVCIVLIVNANPNLRERYPDVEEAATRLRPVAQATGCEVSIKVMSTYLLRQVLVDFKK